MPSSDPRLDLLIYAHDGRGLGHASRGVAVGAAVRRLFPKLRVLFISGCRQTAALIGAAPLDWIKLPAYEKVLVNGAPRARVGNTNLKNSYLVRSRTRLIQSIVNEYRPRCVLVDHEARGKRAELQPSIEGAKDTLWVLGLRGIVGRVGDVWSDAAVEIFRKHYRALLWYGDKAILGKDAFDAISTCYGKTPVVTGYVSRLKEMRHWGADPADNPAPVHAGTIAVSWNSPAASSVLNHLRTALSRIGEKYGDWQIFANFGHALFKDLPFCRIQDLSPRYLHALQASRVAMVYGGYNSMTDILCARIPAVVLLRDVDDHEQEAHIGKLAASDKTAMVVVPETAVTADGLQAALEMQLNTGWPRHSGLDLDGAENAAKKIADYLNG